MNGNQEITNFVLAQLEVLQNHDALAASGLIQEMAERFPQKLPTKTRAANRLNSILNQPKIKMQFTKIKGKDKKPYVIRSQQLLLEGII